MLKLATPLALIATAGAALAHPGHDAAVSLGTAHWLTEWSHWIVLALAGLVARRVRQEDQIP